MWRVKTVTKFKNSFFPDLIYWNDIEIHLGFQHSYLVPPPTEWHDICQSLVKRSSINFGLIQQPSTYPSKMTSASSKLIGISNHLSTSPQPPSININSRKHHSKTAAALSSMLLVMVLMVLKMAAMVMVIHIKRETEVPSILVKWLPALSALLTYSHHTTTSGADRWFGKDSTLFIHTHA